MRRVVSHVSPVPNTTVFSFTPSSTVSVPRGDPGELGQSARAGMIASRSGPACSSSVSLNESRYESVAAMKSLLPSNRTWIPVSTGRDSSFEADRATRSTVSRSDAVAIVWRRRVDRRQAREVLGREDVQLRGVAPARDVRDAVLRPVLDRHLGGRQKARQVDEKLPGHDDGAVALDLRGERRAQRELHVGGGELEPVAVRAQEHAGENLNRASGRDDARNGCELGDELVSVARDLEPGSDRYVCFTS